MPDYWTSSTNSKNLHTYAYYTTKNHQTPSYYQQVLGILHGVLKKAKFHLQEGCPVLPPWMGQPLPCPRGSGYRGHVTGFLSHTQHMVDIQITAGLATKGTPHTQPQHPVQSGRVAESDSVANWREGDRAQLQGHLLCFLT